MLRGARPDRDRALAVLSGLQRAYRIRLRRVGGSGSADTDGTREPAALSEGMSCWQIAPTTNFVKCTEVQSSTFQIECAIEAEPYHPVANRSSSLHNMRQR
jgi:hypothetical protein